MMKMTIIRTRIVDDHGLGDAAHLRIALRGAEPHHFVVAGYDCGDLPVCRAGFGDRLDQRRMIAAEIGEDAGHAFLLEGIKQRRAGSVHGRGLLQPALCNAL
jgi:hypothetical protein